MNPKRLGRNLVVTLGIVSALALLGCSKSAPVIHAGPPPTGPTVLKLKWPAGSRVETTVDLKQPMETRIPGQPEPMHQDLLLTQKYASTVLSESPEGGHVVEMEIAGTRLSMKGQQGDMEFDTSDKASENTPTGAAARKLVGAKVQIYLDASNEVQKVEGMDELKKLIGPAKKNDPMGILTDLTSEDTFRSLMKSSQSLPGTPVQPGDSWPQVHTESHSRTMGIMVTDHTYTFKNWERRNDHNVAHLEFDGTITSKPGEDLRISGMPATMQGGKSSGEAWFDLEEGMFVDGTVTQDMTITLTLPKQAGPMAGQSITVSLNQFITVKMVRTR